MKKTIAYWILRGNLLAQSFIILTGAVVRVTGSGLGCPTWPKCTSDSFFPVDAQEEGWHKYIEFGNRILALLVLVFAIASFIVIWKEHKKSSLRWFAFGIPFGTFLQGVVGGIAVLAGLNPFTVMTHFLLSIGILALSMYVFVEYHTSAIFETHSNTTILFRLSSLLLFSSLLVIVIGTIVTGSGKHAGDSAAQRLSIDVVDILHIHVSAVMLYTGSLLALIVVVYSTNIRRLLRLLVLLMVLLLIQGLVGHFQWINDLPEVLVIVHIAIALIMWNTTTYIFFHIRKTKQHNAAKDMRTSLR